MAETCSLVITEYNVELTAAIICSYKYGGDAQLRGYKKMSPFVPLSKLKKKKNPAGVRVLTNYIHELRIFTIQKICESGHEVVWQALHSKTDRFG